MPRDCIGRVTRSSRPRSRPQPADDGAHRRRVRLLLAGMTIGLLIALAFLLVGRGGRPQTPEATLEAYYRAIGGKDTAAACELTSYAGAPLKGSDLTLCRSGLDAVVRDAASPDDLTKLRSAHVTRATVTGDRATVAGGDVTGVPAAYQVDITLVRVDGTWYVDTPE